MARIVERLDTQKVKRLTAPGYHADGGGLYLQIGKGRARSWVYRFTLRKRTREMGLGSAADVSLGEARLAARAARGLRARGIDPIEDRRAQAAATAAPAVRRPTFREEAESYIDAHEAGWKSAKHAAQWRSTLEAYAHPTIGALPVADVGTDHVAKILAPIWRSKTETAKRVRGRIEAILDRARVRGHRQGENPARWAGHFEHVLPAPGAVAKTVHHPALPYDELPSFMALLRQQRGFAARALELTILSAVRTIETVGARPAEFDLVAALWDIPAERMKKKRPHRVPLSQRAVEIVRALHLDDRLFMFPGEGRRGHLSEGAMLALLGRMGFGHVTVHGFRSTFTDWAADCTEFQPELVDVALAHKLESKTKAAYRRGDAIEKRRALMEAWAGFCSTPSAVDAGEIAATVTA